MITLFFDGACGPKNPGGNCGGGVVIFKGKELLAEIYEKFKPKDKKQTSNNVGEYFALIKGLEYLLNNNLENENITVLGDSNLVIKQMSNQWRIKKGIYYEQALICEKLIHKFPSLRFEWIPREENEWADFLSKKSIE